MFKLFDFVYDHVIKSHYLTASISYGDALLHLYPSIGRLEMQREKQNYKFYSRLADDLLLGCVMPPITIAIINPKLSTNQDATRDDVSGLINGQDPGFFVLDGIQRLSTLYRVRNEDPDRFENVSRRPLHANILICSNYDLLLYRMITLNNGQKPMTARHQIEVIAGNVFDFDSLDIEVQTEKRKPNISRKKGAFKKADIIKGYLAFLSNNVNIDNSKIIESKMDDILARKVIESDITNSEVGFEQVVDLISKFSGDDDYLKSWFQQQNNLIGFCAGCRHGYFYIDDLSSHEFRAAIETFELAFETFDVSRIKVGLARRLSVQYFTTQFSLLSEYDELDLAAELVNVI